MDDFSDIPEENLDHATWLRQQILQMESWVSDKQKQELADPKEIVELENHIKWLKAQLAKHQ